MDINQHKHMSNAIQNSHHNKYMSYNLHTTMINEYNNPHQITYNFPTLFLFGICVQSCGSPNFGNFGIPTWEFWDKMTLGCWPHDHAQIIL